jgi:hypothetical protein
MNEVNIFKDYDPADVLVSVPNILILTLLVIVGVNFMKFVTAKFYIPGLTQLTQNV